MSYVFISHASKDHQQVKEKILSLLQTNGISTWYCTDDIKTSEEFNRKIVSAIDDCSWFVVAITSHAIESRWVAAEVERAFTYKRDQIIPVLLEACDYGKLLLPLTLIQHVDLTQNVELGQAKLLDKLGQVHPSIPQRSRLHTYLRATLLLVATALVGLIVWHFWSPQFSSHSDAIKSPTQISAGENANGANTKTGNQSIDEKTTPTGKLTPRNERVPSNVQANNQNANQR